jgi:hypothetical protein
MDRRICKTAATLPLEGNLRNASHHNVDPLPTIRHSQIGKTMIAGLKRLLRSQPDNRCEVHYRMAEDMVNSGEWKYVQAEAKSPDGVVVERVGQSNTHVEAHSQKSLHPGALTYKRS